jgi:hypothetical protein
MEIRMSRLHTTTALTAAALLLAAAPAAMAKTDVVGNANGTANTNVCVAQIKCTYVNYKNGKPTDVVRHTGKLTAWTLHAASVGGTVRLRVLRPAGHGKLTFIRSSALRTITGDVNTFPAQLKVRRGDVLALTNDTSGLYMRTAPAGTCVRYFNYDEPQTTGSTGKPDRTVPQLHLLLTAKVAH